MGETIYLKYIWIITLISAFLGTYLSWSEVPNLYGFRLFLLFHSILFGALLLLKMSRRGRELKWGFRVKPYFIFLALWLTWGVFSLLWAPSVLFGIKHLFYLGSGCLVIFFTVFYFPTIKDIKILFMVNILVLVFEIVLGLWELASGLHVYGSFPNYYLRHNFLPIIGTFGHPNNFATYLSMYLPLLYVWGKYGKNKIGMIFSFVMLILGFYLIVSSTSRANMMAMILGVVVAITLMVINHWKRLHRSFIKVITVLIIICGMGIFTYTYHYSEMPQNQLSQEVMSVFTNWEKDGSINVRKTLILKGLDMLKGSYGFGVGPGNSQFIMMEQYQDETFGFVKMHNWWVEVLVDYGVFIWSLLLLFFAKMLGDLFRIYRASEHQSLKMWAEGLIISLCMFSLGVISNGSMMASVHMWILFALVLCVINVDKLNVEGR